MLDMLEAFGRVLGSFWSEPGQPGRSKVLNWIYTIFFVLVVGFAAYVIFT